MAAGAFDGLRAGRVLSPPARLHELGVQVVDGGGRVRGRLARRGARLLEARTGVACPGAATAAICGSSTGGSSAAGSSTLGSTAAGSDTAGSTTAASATIGLPAARAR